VLAALKEVIRRVESSYQATETNRYSEEGTSEVYARRDVDYLDYSGVFDEWFHLELRFSGKVRAVSSPPWRSLGRARLRRAGTVQEYQRRKLGYTYGISLLTQAAFVNVGAELPTCTTEFSSYR